MKLGPYALEQDYSAYVAYASSVIFAVVGTATKGEVGVPTVCTSPSDLTSKFGPVSPDCLALYAGQYFLNQSSKLWFVRAAHESVAKATVSVKGIGQSSNKATATIAGTTSTSTSVPSALVLRASHGGETFNSYKIQIGNVSTSDDTFSLILRDEHDTILESHSHLALATIGTEFSSKYLTFESKGSTAVKLTAGTYNFVGGTGEIAEGLKFKAITPGTYYNHYRVKIEDVNETNKTFTLCVLNEKDIAVETCKSLKMSTLNTEFTSNYVVLESIASTVLVPQVGIYELTGGNDGLEGLNSADYITAGNTLATDHVDMNLFAVPGVSEASVINEMLSLAENRGDCMYLVDPPSGLTEDGVANWHNGTGAYSHTRFNSSYGALYYSWQRIYDSVNRTYLMVPPSVPVSATIAYSARTTELWYPPAGLTRGLIRGVLDSEISPDTSKRDYLYSDENSVNCIINDPQAGLCVYGQKTLSRANTALNRVNVRMLLNYLKRIVVAACRYLTFEPNDRVTWNRFEDMIEPTLKSIKSRRGLVDYKIVKGESIVTDNDIDNYRMPCKIMIKPTKSAEEIPIYFTITSTGADFNEVLESEGIFEY